MKPYEIKLNKERNKDWQLLLNLQTKILNFIYICLWGRCYDCYDCYVQHFNRLFMSIY